MNKYFYPIFKLPTFYERDYVKEELPLWIKWWLLGKAGRELSEILTGSEFTLLHTVARKFKILQIKGNTEQEQLSGKNKLQLKDGTYTSSSQNLIVENGIASFEGSVGSGGLGFYIPLEKSVTLSNGETNTFSVNIEGTVPNYRIAIRLLKTNYETDANSFGRTFVGVVNNKATITATQEEDETYTYAFLFIIADTSNLNFKAFYQLEQGSTATSYEPYCGGIPSPNPDFPQQIKNVTGNANVKIQNKNLFDGALELGIYSGSTGQKVSNNEYVRSTNYIEVNELTNYKFSNDGVGISLDIYEYKEDYSYNLTGTKLVNSTSHLTTEAGTKYITFRTYSKTTDTNMKIQLEQGSTATSYVPHQEQNYPFTFAEGQILGNNEELTDNGKEDIWGEYIFTGNENWVDYQGTQTGDFYKFYTTGVRLGRTNNMEARANAFCTHFINNNFYENNNGIGLTQNATYISINKTIASTPEELKTWFATQYANGKPVKVQYKKKNPTVTAYTEIQQAQYNAIKQARSYNDITIISSTSDELPPELEIQYWKERGAE